MTGGDAAQAVTVQCRTYTDLCNTVIPGSLADEDLGDQTSVLLRNFDILQDECRDVLQQIQYSAYGTSDLARAVATAVPLIRTCMMTSEITEESCRPLTYPMAMLAKNRNAETDRKAITFLTKR